MKHMNTQWIAASLLAAGIGVLLFFSPEKRIPFTATVTDYSLELILVLPAVLLLMGLLSSFISNELISTHLGRGSGIKGMAIAFALGTLPTGPVYMAFPIARTLHSKGARVANLYIFLSTWACIKVPQEIIEFRFLGPQFMAYRLIITVVLVSAMSILVEHVFNAHPEKEKSG